jgi:replicative DNA helicase
MPTNVEAEQALLGAVLLNNDAFGVISAMIGPEHFVEPLHAEIFAAAGRFIADGKKATPISLKDAFPGTEVMPGMTVQMYLAKLAAECVSTSIGLPQLGANVRDLALMRKIIWVGEDLRRAATDGYAPDEALRRAWEMLDGLRMGQAEDAGDRGSIADLVQRLIAQDGAESSFSISTGLTDLDRSIAGGWRAGRLYVLAGRPGMGKTVIAWSSARRVANQGVGVAGYSLEIDAHEVTARLISDALCRTGTPVPYRDIVAGTLDQAQRSHRNRAAATLEKIPLRVDATGGVSMGEIEARCRVERDRFARQGVRLGVVFIDYLGLVRATDRYRGSKVNELGEIALAAKTMAKRLDIAVVLLAQLNRSVEQRDDKRPNMSDLRDSGNIEEHADVVGLLYRPAYYDARSRDPEAQERALDNPHRLELILGKNRLGPTMPVDLWCDMANNAVDNWQRY